MPQDQTLDRLIGRGKSLSRVDDTTDTIRHRIEVYFNEPFPLVDYYTERDILVRIDATGAIDAVTSSITSAVDAVLERPTRSEASTSLRRRRFRRTGR
jgi:adenylate kinase